MIGTFGEGFPDEVNKRAQEIFLDRDLSAAEWEGSRPRPDETLTDALLHVRGRSADYEPQLAAIVGIRPLSESVAKDLEDVVLAARTWIFNGRETPPFADLWSAILWCCKQAVSKEAKRNARCLGERVTTVHGTHLARLWLARSPLITEFAEHYQFLVPAEQWVPTWLELPASTFGAPANVPRVVSHVGMPRRLGERGGILLRCSTAKLALLATFAQMVGEASKCWSNGQAAGHILTGQLPRLPKLRVWIDEVPGGATLPFLQILGPLGCRDIQHMTQILRKANG